MGTPGRAGPNGPFPRPDGPRTSGALPALAAYRTEFSVPEGGERDHGDPDSSALPVSGRGNRKRIPIIGNPPPCIFIRAWARITA